MINYKEFGLKNPLKYFSPGRVNLIGEHIDYHGGKVFPTGITLGTYAFVEKREDDVFRFQSTNFEEIGVIEVALDALSYNKKNDWANYLVGMIDLLIKRGHNINHGLDIVISGTLPNGAGLSSSASIEVLMGVILDDIFQLKIDMFDLVQYAQEVENDYIGVNCGIMDQFAVGMSQKDTAILLDTNSLEFQHVPLRLGDYILVIANTNKRRTLADSKYNERVTECKEALNLLQNRYNINHLCELDSADLPLVRELIEDDVTYNRVVHAVTENERTNASVESLIQNDLHTFGRYMNESHDSLRDMYEVSCEELDVLVEAFRANNAIGARMTGAGFGGCAIALVHKKDLKTSLKNVQQIYIERVGYEASFYETATQNGAGRIE